MSYVPLMKHEPGAQTRKRWVFDYENGERVWSEVEELVYEGPLTEGATALVELWNAELDGIDVSIERIFDVATWLPEPEPLSQEELRELADEHPEYRSFLRPPR